jgi:hypothetical protein
MPKQHVNKIDRFLLVLLLVVSLILGSTVLIQSKTIGDMSKRIAYLEGVNQLSYTACSILTKHYALTLLDLGKTKESKDMVEFSNFFTKLAADLAQERR